MTTGTYCLIRQDDLAVLIILQDLDEKSIDINCGDMIPFSISFREDGSQFVGGGIYPNDFTGWLQQWLAKDGNEVPASQVHLTARVYGVVASKDSKWIVNVDGKSVEVRTAATGTLVFKTGDHIHQVLAIDVSNDSTQFASGSEDKTVNTYNVTTRIRMLGPLQHDYPVVGVKFSPSGDYIATAASGSDGEQYLGSLKVWNAKSGGKPVIDIPVQWKNLLYPSTPLAWSSDGKNLFYIAAGKITCLTISTSKSFEWSVPTSLDPAACSLATNGKFIACSAGGSISLWDPDSHTQLGSTITRDGIILSLALSPDNSHLACGTIYGAVHKIGLYILGDILPLEVLVDVNTFLSVPLTYSNACTADMSPPVYERERSGVQAVDQR